MKSARTWMILGLLMMPLSESLAQEVPMKTTCHEGRCKRQHPPVDRRNILRELRLKTLEKDRKSKSPLTQPVEPPGSLQKEQRPLSLRRLGLQSNEISTTRNSKCEVFASNCKTRVDNLEKYRREADAVIEAQGRQIVAEKEKKQKFPWVHVTISVLVGALTGVVLF